MCGFVGFVSEMQDKKAVLNAMMDKIVHRGPDSAGEYIDGDVALGFRRLSIIDLNSGDQPIYNEDGTVAITYNGEIYNFAELRSELRDLGHVFKTEGDTEVIVHGYEQWGEDVVMRLRGMFAFVLWDRRSKTLFGARDWFGIKPFYYAEMGGSFLFASEIKAMLPHPEFKKEVNRDALRPYMELQYSALDESFFKGVFRLLPAHTLTYHAGELTIKRYWEPEFDEKERPLDRIVDEIDAAMRESVKYHKISDVKTGAFLSGGIDSSYVTTLMEPQQSFSVGFSNDHFDESVHAGHLSEILGIENFREVLTPEECFDNFEKIQYHMDEPQSNPSSVPLFFLARLARREVTVVLSGEGADELFGGYEDYRHYNKLKKYNKLPRWIRVFLAKVAKRLPYFHGREGMIKAGSPAEDYFFGEAHVYNLGEANALLRESCRRGPTAREVIDKYYARVKNCDDITKMQYLDIMSWMPGDILLKADKMSMAHSLELRVPFLDKEIMGLAATIPPKYRVNDINTKYALRLAAARVIPDEWAKRQKMGFPVPIRFWLEDKKFSDIVRGYFDTDYADEFFDREKLLKMLDEHLEKKQNHARKIWVAYTFLVWYKVFFIDGGVK